MSTTENVDGGDAVLAVGDMLAGIEPSDLRRAGDDARRGKATQTFIAAVRHIVGGGPTTRADVANVERRALGENFPGEGGAAVHPIHGAVGDRFECVVAPCERIPDGSVARVVRIDDSDRVIRWRTLAVVGLGEFVASLSELRNMKLFRPLPSSADRAAESPALQAAVLGPSADAVLLDQIRKLIPASRAYQSSLDSYAPYQDVSTIVATLATSIGYDRKAGA